MSERHVLVAVDDTDATVLAVNHVAAEFAAGSARIRLFHVVGPVPPALLEFGGASDPDEERRIEQEMTEEEARWFKGEQEKVRPLLESTRDRLIAAGVEADRISVHIGDSLPEDRLAHLVLDDAKEAGCDTIVVGHKAYGWLGERFQRHVGDELTKHASDIEVVVVRA